MSQLNDLSRSLTSLEQDNTIIAVIEMSQSSWLVVGIVPGIERHPLKKLEPSEAELLRLLMRWRAEATKVGCTITRIVVAYEAGRDGFWLARWLRARDIEAYVIHPTSVAVSREHRRAKTDRLDTGLLKRVFIGWLRSEPDHCHMAAIPTLAEEDAKRPNREREGLVRERTRIVNRIQLAWRFFLFPNVWLGTTTEDAERFRLRWPILSRIPAARVFVSYEPAIGPLERLDICECLPDWVICGGESGGRARVMLPAWARQVRDQCRALGIAFLLKQWGTYRGNPLVLERGLSPAEAKDRDLPINGKGGALLDGRLHREFPGERRAMVTAPVAGAAGW